MEIIEEAVANGARQFKACEILGISERTLQRWKLDPEEGDRREGPYTEPANSLTPHEVEKVLEVANSRRFRDLPPSQIVPILADEGTYIASESSFYRILKKNKQLTHRSVQKAPIKRAVVEYEATSPNQVWTWDITYLKSTIKGLFYYLYMIVDIFSRKIIDWAIHETESSDYASVLINRSCIREGIQREQLILHSDNGSPMKGATMLATMQLLGVIPSFSRPKVSNDNPYSESLFKTLKYRPEYPTDCFESIESANEWMKGFVNWYNNEHRHSGINYVTPNSKHLGKDIEILKRRKEVIEQAKKRNPLRWSRTIRNCNPIISVVLNPGKKQKEHFKKVSGF